MNRVVILLLVAFSIFSTLIYINMNYISHEDESSEYVVDQEPTFAVYVTSIKVERSQTVEAFLFSEKQLNQSDLSGFQYTPPEELVVKPGAIFKKDLVAGTLLTQGMISNPGDRDYILLSLKKGELPYFYEVNGIGVVQISALNTGEKVSFVSTTSSTSNLLETGYGDIGDLISKVIISGARVLQVIKGSEDSDAEDAEDKTYSLVIALKMRDVLKLEMAQKIGDVNIIPSEIENRYLSIRSSDLLENQFGVRELRGKE
ncbi:pilus assembly protein CpaB [Vibrio tapetis]|uniref:Pilus assembly protein CpaB n=1 Tax=Vibrio tapetis subsp. tapetis TaxID=1671868 RepID=A0A2N8ZLE4_9VIBR|nr:pilus assembly protein CpaB [Vibrio tapetis]SON52715.1 conserved protein of unknown function [Vibrio tapetis subsp. tapetis]